MTETNRSYLVCATPRSGSTLVCQTLIRTGVAGRPEEYFEALRSTGVPRRPEEYFHGTTDQSILDHLGQQESAFNPQPRSPLWSRTAYDRYIDWVLEAGTTPNGVFGAKLMLYIVIPYLPERMREAAAIALEFDRPQHQSCFGFFVRESSQRKLPPLRTNLNRCRPYDVSRSSDISSSIRPNASPAAHKIRLRMAKR